MAEALNSRSRAGRPATILDIARHVGMSKTTVSDALAGTGRLLPETREIILQAAKELNYRAHPHAQSLRKRNSDEIILVSGSLDLGVSTRKMTQIQRQLSCHGFNASIHAFSQEGDSRLNQSTLLESVARIRPRAVVCNAMFLEEKSKEILLSLQSQASVVLCYDFEITGPEQKTELDQIIFDRADNTYQATRHLLELGHREIGTVTFSNSPTSPLRLAGFQRAMAEVAADSRPEWHFARPAAPADFIEITGQQAAQYFLGLERRPTAVVIAVGDLGALAFMGEMHRAGVRVPDDMSVIGQDNLPICQFVSLRLSSVSHPVETISTRVADRLVARLVNPDLPPEKHWIKGELFSRESTATLG